MDVAPLPPPLDLARVAAVVDGVLQAAHRLLGCELVALNRGTERDVLTARTAGALPGLTPGVATPRSDVLCDLVLAGSPHVAVDAAHDPLSRRSRSVSALGLRTYVGVPVRDRAGVVVASLCGFDRRVLEVPEPTVRVLTGLAAVLTQHVDRFAELDAVLGRRDGRWRVQGVGAEDSPYALVALLADEPLPPPVDEEAWLRAQLDVLQTALQERVLLEQAVGVLAERLRVAPREAFAALRGQAGERPGDGAGGPGAGAAGDVLDAARRVLATAAG